MDTSGKQIGKEVFFARLEAEAPDDDIVFYKSLIGCEKILVVSDNGGFYPQKIISENRW